jgi:hypothetical protein
LLVGSLPREYDCIEQNAEKDRQRRSRIVQILNVPQRVRLRSSLAAALLDSLFEHSATLICGLRGIAMKKFRCSWLFIVGLLVMMELFGCNQEKPAEKAKAAAESGSAATQAAGQAAVDAIQTPMDQARQTESVLGQSAAQRAAEAKKATE